MIVSLQTTVVQMCRDLRIPERLFTAKVIPYQRDYSELLKALLDNVQDANEPS